jgi:hypothetical protein
MKVLQVSKLDRQTEKLLQAAGIQVFRCKSITGLSPFAQAVRSSTVLTNKARTITDEESVFVFVAKPFNIESLSEDEVSLLNEITDTLKREYDIEVEVLW